MNIFILKTSSYKWYKAEEKELENWLNDGSLAEGDLIVYPQTVKVVKKIVKLKVEKVKQ